MQDLSELLLILFFLTLGIGGTYGFCLQLDSLNPNGTIDLNRKIDYYEKILLEKEIELRTALDQIELLKKTNNKKGNRQE